MWYNALVVYMSIAEKYANAINNNVICLNQGIGLNNNCIGDNVSVW
jgi:hypothetical protein